MFKQSLFALALAAASVAASAMTFERNTTIQDDFSGQAVIQSSGELGDGQSTRVAIAQYTNFHPHRQDRWANGTVTREAVRDGELVTVTYDGSLVLSAASSTGNAPSTTISFDDLKIIKDAEGGVDLEGTLVLNGEPIDADEAPARVRSVLLGLLRFFRI